MSTPAMRSSHVAIVGAGVMGCATALRLRQAGLPVTIVERGIPGAEASSAAAGILGPQWEADGPGPLFDLGLRSRAMYPAFVEELRALTGIDVGYRPSGLVELAMDEEGLSAISVRQRWQRARGLAGERVEGAALRALVPGLGPRIVAGLWLADEAHVNARVLARALAQAAAQAGACFLQGRHVRRIRIEHGRVTGLDLDGESLGADAVVVAAGSWSGLVEGALGAEVVRPARGQMAAIEMRPPLFHHVLAPFGGGYLVPRADGIALAGSTFEQVGFRKEVTVAGLADILTMARAVLPGLEALPVVETWSNFRPYTPDRLPVIGRGEVEGLYLATGHHRYGILLAPITAAIVAAQLCGRDFDVDLSPFSTIRFATDRGRLAGQG